MRVEVFGNGYEVSEMLRTYAESHVWLAVNRAAEHLSSVGVRLMGDEGHTLRRRVVCQLDVWLRGIGLVAVLHTDVNPYVAIDRAAVRLERMALCSARADATGAGRGRRSPPAAAASRARFDTSSGRSWSRLTWHPNDDVGRHADLLRVERLAGRYAANAGGHH